MLFTPLLIAETAAERSGAVEGFVQLLRGFGVNVPGILAQMLSFCVVAYVLWRFAFKPVIATLDERQKKIESGLKYAEEMKAKLEQTRQESLVVLKDAQTAAAKIIEEASKTAKEFSDREQKAAAGRALDLIAKAQQTIELEKKKMLADARGEIARLVVATTQRVLAKELNDAERARYNESAARELNSV
ncbi:MAG: F0F1 ATP synthase subunit B [Verrucomicrobiota bacterium]|nr:F0F1 ATP synthase subunit B [Verrucomicrobiota bacterium]